MKLEEGAAESERRSAIALTVRSFTLNAPDPLFLNRLRR